MTDVTVMAEGEIDIALAAAATTACVIFACRGAEVTTVPLASAMICVTWKMAVRGREGCWVGVPGKGLGRYEGLGVGGVEGGLVEPGLRVGVRVEPPTGAGLGGREGAGDTEGRRVCPLIMVG